MPIRPHINSPAFLLRSAANDLARSREGRRGCASDQFISLAAGAVRSAGYPALAADVAALADRIGGDDTDAERLEELLRAIAAEAAVERKAAA